MAGVAAGKLQCYGLLVGTEPGTGPAFPQGSVISRIKVFQNSTTFTPTAVNNVATSEQVFTMSGLKADDTVFGWSMATPPTDGHTVISNVRVSAANSLAITFANASAATATPAAITPNQLSVFVVNVDTF